MPFTNFESQEKIFKVVYWGPSLVGKTENLKSLVSCAREDKCGELIILATETQRTAYFEFLPVSLGTLNNFKVRLHLFTVPGAQGYESSRNQILKGADAVVFVTDHDSSRLEENTVSHRELIKSLEEQAHDVKVPIVYQFNKVDLQSGSSAEKTTFIQNSDIAPKLFTTASSGDGVFETLRAVVKTLF